MPGSGRDCRSAWRERAGRPRPEEFLRERPLEGNRGKRTKTPERRRSCTLVSASGQVRRGRAAMADAGSRAAFRVNPERRVSQVSHEALAAGAGGQNVRVCGVIQSRPPWVIECTQRITTPAWRTLFVLFAPPIRTRKLASQLPAKWARHRLTRRVFSSGHQTSVFFTVWLTHREAWPRSLRDAQPIPNRLRSYHLRNATTATHSPAHACATTQFLRGSDRPMPENFTRGASDVWPDSGISIDYGTGTFFALHYLYSSRGQNGLSGGWA